MATIWFDNLELTGTSLFLTAAPTGLIPAGGMSANVFAIGRGYLGTTPLVNTLVDFRVYRYGVQLMTMQNAGARMNGQFMYRTDDTRPINGEKV